MFLLKIYLKFTDFVAPKNKIEFEYINVASCLFKNNCFKLVKIVQETHT